MSLERKVIYSVANSDVASPRVVVQHDNTQKFDLGKWRRARLGEVKATPQYKKLPSTLQKVVDYLVLTYESPDKGIIVAQGNPKLLARFGISRRQTMSKWLAVIVDTEVFTVTPQRNRAGTQGGRTTNCYRLNPALLSPVWATDAHLTASSTAHTEVRLSDVHVEALSRESACRTDDANEVSGFAAERQPESGITHTTFASTRVLATQTCAGCGAEREALMPSGYCSSGCRERHEAALKIRYDEMLANFRGGQVYP